MKYLSIIITLNFILLLPIALFPQSSTVQNNPENQRTLSLWNQRNQQLRDAIIQDIGLFKSKDRAQYYAQLAETYWAVDKHESAGFLSKAVEIALDPATDYLDDKERIILLTRILARRDVFERDIVSGKKLLSEINETLIAGIRDNGPDHYRNELIYLATFLVKYDVKQALEYAMFILNGKNPKIDPISIELFKRLNARNESLADQYLNKLLASLHNNPNDYEQKRLAVWFVDREFRLQTRNPFSDQQQKEILLTLLILIEKESEELSGQRRQDCTLDWFGKEHIDAYERLLPQKIDNLRRAMNVCETLASTTRKVNSLRKTPKSPEDFLELAAAESDKKKRSRLSFLAATAAYSSKDYKHSIAIMDTIDEDLRDDPWQVYRKQASERLLKEYMGDGKFDEIKVLIDNAPEELRPNIIIGGVARFGAFAQENRQFTEDLSNQARTGIKKMKFPPPSELNSGMGSNPAKLMELVRVYYYLSNEEEALNVFSEYVELLNLLSGRYSHKNNGGQTYSYFAYSSIPKKLLTSSFDRIYQDAARIQSPRIRLQIRMSLLWDNKTASGSRSGFSKMRIDY